MPLEWPLLILALVFVSGFLRKGFCVLLALLALMLMLLRIADIGSYLAFNRRFSPLLELHLIKDGWNLVSTSTSPLQAVMVAMIALLVLVVIVWALYRCLLRIASVSGKLRTQTAALAALAAVFIGAGVIAENRFDYNGPAQANIIPEFNNRITRLTNSIADQKVFVEELKFDTVLDDTQPEFTALAGKDVFVIFVESYGRGYVEAERFSRLAQERLDSVQATLDKSSVFAKSGWVTSPIRGGRSWLAHASFQAGLNIDNQARYDRLVTTERPSFSALFEAAGWNTFGIMPAIQFEWPEGAWYDYQQLFVAADMQFEGERLGYTTMPDQYTLAHFENAIRKTSDKPLMATFALLTTHAPWTPLPRKLDWNSVGNGSIYDGSNRFGERISWKYRSKVQDMYVQSFDYTLDILGEYAALYGDNAVFIILGDHQPPPIINGWGNSGDVPIHILSKDESVLDKLPEQYWTQGMLPSADTPSQPMWDMRRRFSTMFE